MKKYTVVSLFDDRIDKVLALSLPSVSRERLKNLILESMVKCNNVIISSPSHKLKIGDKCEIIVPDVAKSHMAPADIKLDIVYEDNNLLIINKPPYFTVHPGAGTTDNTLVNALLHHCKGSLSGIGGVERPGIVHRIDRNTSGLMVVAKNDATHIGLSEQFAAHSIDRAYRALVYGILVPKSGTVDKNIVRHSLQRTKMTTTESKGKRAVTHYKTLYVNEKGLSLVECRLETGRTHQIRVHMNHIGHPLVGDLVYSKNNVSKFSQFTDEQKKVIKDFKRQALHAYMLGFIHPISGEKMLFTSKEPQDLLDLYEALEIELPV